MSGLNAGYSDHLSVSALQRLHTDAVLGYIGQERVEHLKHVDFAVSEALTRYKQDPKLDQEQFEVLTKLSLQVKKDLQDAVKNNVGMVPDEDESPNEP